MRKTHSIQEVIEREKTANQNKKKTDQHHEDTSKPRKKRTSFVVPIIAMLLGLLIFVTPFYLLFAKIGQGSSERDLGNNYHIVTLGGSEGWCIWGKVDKEFDSSTLVIWNTVRYIGANDQYIVGLREKGGHPMHEEYGIKNPQPYGYFIINKYTDEKIMGLTEEEAKVKFAEVNISMDLLEKTSRLYHWKGEQATQNQ
ncbi:hypothetical protein [Sulfurovum sp.]|uniref:hypothetical protein n=1 Tax=Sulfurovum sp. TaxID=1969726 RepID=UPI0035616335